MDDTGEPTQDGQTDVDQEVGTTSALQEDTQRRQDDGENDLADVTVKSSQPWCFARVRPEPEIGAREKVELLSCSSSSRGSAGVKTTYEAVKGMMTVGLS